MCSRRLAAAQSLCRQLGCEMPRCQDSLADCEEEKGLQWIETVHLLRSFSLFAQAECVVRAYVSVCSFFVLALLSSSSVSLIRGGYGVVV